MKFSAAALLALPLLAVATPTELAARTGSGSCSTGSLQCCNSTITSAEAQANPLFGLLGVVLGSVTGLVGLGCSPLTVIGVGDGGACSAAPVCCDNTQLGGLIGVGCIPITL